jgi:hypothetical protein
MKKKSIFCKAYQGQVSREHNIMISSKIRPPIPLEPFQPFIEKNKINLSEQKCLASCLHSFYLFGFHFYQFILKQTRLKISCILLRFKNYKKFQNLINPI